MAQARIVRAKGLVWLSTQQSHWQQGMASLAGRRLQVAFGKVSRLDKARVVVWLGALGGEDDGRVVAAGVGPGDEQRDAQHRAPPRPALLCVKGSRVICA